MHDHMGNGYVAFEGVLLVAAKGHKRKHTPFWRILHVSMSNLWGGYVQSGDLDSRVVLDLASMKATQFPWANSLVKGSLCTSKHPFMAMLRAVAGFSHL